MSRIKISLCLTIGFAHLVTVYATCAICSVTSYAACLNETGFAMCLDGMRISDIHGVCPDGQVCTDKEGICRPKESDRPTCGKCNTCLGKFSCRSRSQFELCSENMPNGVVLHCPEGEYCSLKNFIKDGNICAKSCLEEPTCYADEVAIPPPPKPIYTDVCKKKGVRGLYQNIYDPTCKTFVFCKK